MLRTLAAAFTLTLAAHGQEPPHTKFAFGSCCGEGQAAPIFEAITRFDPDVWIWLGDNIYGDSEDPAVLERKWAMQSMRPGYRALADTAKIIGTWDDHDYGANDAGKEFPIKAEAQQLFLDFLDEWRGSARRKQEGVYWYHDFGPEGKQVRVILLDTRYHRDPIGSDGDMLGEAQWQWLENTLRDSDAQIHLLVSSIQVIAEDHRFEKWANFPTEHKRLYQLLKRDNIPPVVILSGDRHLAEISLLEEEVGYPLYDITSSSLNKSFGGNPGEENQHRVGDNYGGTNFGTLGIDWNTPDPTLTATIHSWNGAPVRSITFQLPSK